MKAVQGKIHNWKDGFVAFGIGAAAEAIGAATGGVAFTMAGGAAGGVGRFLAGGVAGTAFASPVQNLGNHLYFGDPLMTPKQYITGIAIGGVTGGIVNGGIAALNGRNFWNGDVLGRPQIASMSSLKPYDKGQEDLKLTNIKKILNILNH